jgi:hypothetical protein
MRGSGHDGRFQLTTSAENQALCQAGMLKNSRHSVLLHGFVASNRVLSSRGDQCWDVWRGNDGLNRGLRFPQKVAPLLELERAAIHDPLQ